MTNQNDGTRKFAEDLNPLADQIAAELGLDPATATGEMVVTAIQDLKAKAAGGAPTPPSVPGETPEQAAARLLAAGGPKPTETEAALTERLAKMDHRELARTYADKAKAWTGIEGTADELGEQLAKVHEDAGKEAAEALAGHYTRVSADTVIRFTKPIGTSMGEKPGDDADPFEKKMWDWAQENNQTPAQASAHFRSASPAEWSAYYLRKKETQEPVTA